jgi:hypothetical protein
MSTDLSLTISRDEALVLFELLSRVADTNGLELHHNSEFLALSKLSSQLEKSLAEPFMPNYTEVLDQARSRVASGYEGLAPGVVQAKI